MFLAYFEVDLCYSRAFLEWFWAVLVFLGCFKILFG